jgi:hypothetical protein
MVALTSVVYQHIAVEMEYNAAPLTALVEPLSSSPVRPLAG